MLLETGYIGNTGQKQIGTVWVNQPRCLKIRSRRRRSPPAPVPESEPGFSMKTNYQWSNYNAGYIKFEKRLSAVCPSSPRTRYSKFIDSGGQVRTCMTAGRNVVLPITMCATTLLAAGSGIFPSERVGR